MILLFFLTRTQMNLFEKKYTIWHLTLVLVAVSCGIGGMTVNSVRAFPGLDEEGKDEDCCAFLTT
jgi:hypothetical protein